MDIKIAPYAGFCFGVQRAMKMAWDELEKSSDIYSLGPLIHNNQAVSKYEEKGLKIIYDLDDVCDNSKLIIRSHGVTLSVYEKAKNKNMKIIDTTCPFVKKIQNIAFKHYSNGFKIIILGDEKHPEVLGINGWCNDEAIIIKEIDEIDGVNFVDEKYCVVAQTTMNMDKYKEIIKRIKDKSNNVIVHNTICLATRQRQESAKVLSNSVDLMIVIGGKHSSNTQKLVGVCNNNCKTYAIETFEELDLKQIKNMENVQSIGITAGASTPDWIIDEVVENLKSI